MHTPLIRSTTHDVQTSSTGSSVPGTGKHTPEDRVGVEDKCPTL
jgi:hypothetical protein